jgi:hypothetical protein
MRQIKFVGRMRIRVDAHHAAPFQRTPVPAPIKIKPPRIRVDFYGYAVLRARGKNLFNVHVISRPSQKLAASHVAEDRCVWI